MRIVVDTNVLVSGMLSPSGHPGQIARMIQSGALSICYDLRLIDEYRSVLFRPQFPFTSTSIDALLGQLQANGEIIFAYPLTVRLIDRSDEAFLEVAASAAVPLVTGNLKHFPQSLASPVLVLSPAAFMDYFLDRTPL